MNSGTNDPRPHEPDLLRELRAELEPTGFFEPAGAFYWIKGALVSALYAGGYGVLLCAPSATARLLSCAIVAFATVQMGGIAHEAGHRAITRSRAFSELLGQLFMTLLGGLGFSYWSWKHRAHHRGAGTAEDPDLDSSLFALRERPEPRPAPWSWIQTHQHLLLPLLATLLALRLKIDSARYLLREPRRALVDGPCFILHVVLWLVVPALNIGPRVALLNYLLVTWVEGAYLALIFMVNHLGAAPRVACGALARQVTASRNIAGSSVTSLLFNGLDSHIEHHLFVDVPSWRLRRGRAVTRAFCEKYGLLYREESLGGALASVYSHLRRMAVPDRRAPEGATPAGAASRQESPRTVTP